MKRSCLISTVFLILIVGILWGSQLARADSTPPTITNVSVEPNPFSPNGDGIKDNTTISFTLSEDAIVTINVGGGAPEEDQILYSAGFNQFQWDGKDAATGLVFADGTYQFTIYAEDTQTVTSNTIVSGSVTIDTEPPAINDVHVSLNPFSPNNDGVNDITEISFGLAGTNPPGFTDNTVGTITFTSDTTGVFTFGPQIVPSGCRLQIVPGAVTTATNFIINGGYKGAVRSSAFSLPVGGNIAPVGTEEFDTISDVSDVSGATAGEQVTVRWFTGNCTVNIYTLEGDYLEILAVNPEYHGHHPTYFARWGPGLGYPDGEYIYRIIAEDNAGNIHQQSGTIVINNNPITLLGVNTSVHTISPANQDGVSDAAVISGDISEDAKVVCKIYHSVDVFDTTTLVKKFGPDFRRATGDGAPPWDCSLTWDGTDENGLPVCLDTTGTFTYIITAIDTVTSETVENTPPRTIVVDNQAPDSPTVDPVLSPTNQNPITVSGEAELGSKVEVFVNSGTGFQSGGTTTADLTTGKYGLDVSLALGSNYIITQATDRDLTVSPPAIIGNVSVFSDTINVLLDQEEPIILSVTITNSLGNTNRIKSGDSSVVVTARVTDQGGSGVSIENISADLSQITGDPVYTAVNPNSLVGGLATWAPVKSDVHLMVDPVVAVSVIDNVGNGPTTDTGTIALDDTPPLIESVTITNGLGNTNTVRNGDEAVTVEAQIVEAGGINAQEITADLSQLNPELGSSVPAASYQGGVATWTAVTTKDMADDPVVTVNAIDDAGNSAISLADTITLDDTAPVITSVTIFNGTGGTDYITNGDEEVKVRAEITESEGINLGGVTADLSQLTGTAGDTSVVATGYVDGLAIWSGITTSGISSDPVVSVKAVDDAGNFADPVSDSIAYDAIAPVITKVTITNDLGNTNTLRNGDRDVVVTAEIVENVSIIPANITADLSQITGNSGDNAVRAASFEGGVATWAQVSSSAMTSDPVVTVNAVDDAGNGASPATGTIALDDTPPRIESVTITNGLGNTSTVRNRDEAVTVEAHIVEAGGINAQEITADLSQLNPELGSSVPAASYQGGVATWAALTTRDMADDPVVTVNAIDDAGNSAISLADTITLDDTAPVITSVTIFNGSGGTDYITNGDEEVKVRAEITESEGINLGGITADLSQLTGAAGDTSVMPTSYVDGLAVWSGITTSGISSDPVVLVKATDDAGNPAVPVSDSIAYDAIAPVITEVTITNDLGNTNTLRNGDRDVVVTAEIVENVSIIPANITADLSQITGNSGDNAVGAASFEAGIATWIPVSSSAMTADPVVLVKAIDDAGNGASPATGTIALDDTPPRIESVTITNGAGGTDYVWNGDTEVTLSAVVIESGGIKVENITADLSSITGNPSDVGVPADNLDIDTGLVTWEPVTSSGITVNPPVTVTATDDAGNKPATAQDTILFFNAAVFDYTVTNDLDTVYKNGDTVSFTTYWRGGVGTVTITADFSNVDSEYNPGDETVVDQGGAFRVSYTISEQNPVSDGTGLVIPITATTAGIVSVTNTSFIVSLDNSIPNAPGLDVLPSTTETPSITITGNSEPLVKILVYRNQQQVSTAVADSAGEFNIPIALVGGINKIKVVAMDMAGNSSLFSRVCEIMLIQKATFIVPSPLSREKGQIMIYVLKPANKATIEVYNLAGDLITTLPRSGPPLAGKDLSINWDCRNDAGDRVNNGIYIFRITINYADGTSQTAVKLGAVVQ